MLFYLLIPLVMLRVGWRSLKEPRYRENIAQRFGFCPVLCQAERSSDNRVWVHAVSAGESIAAVPLIQGLLAQGYSVLVTNMTPTGRQQVERLLGDAVTNCYAPYDMPGAVQRFLRRARPRVLVIIDTELWPNMLHYSHAAGVKTLLVNARLSAHSAAGYKRINNLAHAMMRNLDAVAVQSQEQGERFVGLGLDRASLHVTGSIKFDAPRAPDLEAKTAEFQLLLGDRHVVAAGSTHAGEEDLLIAAMLPVMARQPDWLLVLAPRHTHRADQVMMICEAAGLRIRRRSLDEACAADTQVYLLDTMGELLYLYACADIAFVGGSLVDVGGHNPMEPASLGKPVVMGSYLSHISDITDIFIQDGGLRRADSGMELVTILDALCAQEDLRVSVGEAAQRTVIANRGALALTQGLIVAQFSPQQTQPEPPRSVG
ncbi:MAG: 3-deoxy-D-manno-octulosonic-acid transferase [Candidatus Pseudothioglobus sp.]